MEKIIIERVIEALVRRRGELSLEEDSAITDTLKQFSNYQLQELQLIIQEISSGITTRMIANNICNH